MKSNYPSKNLVKEIKYTRKASIAYIDKHRVKYFIYSLLSKYYGKKHYREIMSS